MSILLALFVLALYTTFHAATRTYFTPLFIGLSMITILGNRKKKTNFAKEDTLINITELEKSTLYFSSKFVESDKNVIDEKDTLPRQ